MRKQQQTPSYRVLQLVATEVPEGIQHAKPELKDAATTKEPYQPKEQPQHVVACGRW